MNTLALDLGTKTGWALRVAVTHGTSFVEYGTWQLATPFEVANCRARNEDRRCDPRFRTLVVKLEGQIRANEIQRVVFEDVLFSETTLQTQLWATWRAAVWSMKELPGLYELTIDCLNTGSLKKFATGKGNATKAMMSAHLLRKYPDEFIKNPKPTANCFLLDKKSGAKVDDNAVDARHLLDYFSPV